MNQYGTYTPSASVTAAQNYLTQVQSNKPGGYVSKWDAQITDLYNKIVNREDFQYDLNSDMLYQQYKDQYTNLGQMAMMDTIGQAAGLTGGYANTYAQNAGQQAYQSYLQQLNEVVPELYGMARDQYNQETQDLYNQFSMTQTLEDTDYGRYRDSISDYQWELGFAADQYNAERNYDFSQFESNRNYALNIANMESEQASENRSYAYDTAMSMISAGIIPSSDILEAAGLSANDASALVSYYQSLSSTGSNSGSGEGDGEEDKYPVEGAYDWAGEVYEDPSEGGPTKRMENFETSYASKASDKAYIEERINAWLAAGKLTSSEALQLMDKYGL